MASMPMDNTASQRGNGKPPISAHPAFPAVVALWFAALLGIGSLILPVRLYETVFAATGISSLIPSATAPLGFTARALIAFVATIAGAGLGFYAARRIIGARSTSFATERTNAGHRPLRPAEDFQTDKFDDVDDLPPLKQEESVPAAGPGRRRALAIAEEEGPSELLNVVPLPGQQGSEMSEIMAHELAEESELEPYQVTGTQDGPFLDAGLHVETAEHEDEEDLQGVAETPVAVADITEGLNDGPEPLAFSPPSLARKAEGPHQPSEDQTENLSQRPFDMPSSGALEEETVPSEQTDTPADFDDSEDRVPNTPIHAANSDAAEPLNLSKHNQLSNPVDDAPEQDQNDPDGLVQLVQKLGNTLEKHRQWSAERASLTSAPMASPSAFSEKPSAQTVPQTFDAAGADDAADAMAAYFQDSDASAHETHEQAEEHSACTKEAAPDFSAPSQAPSSQKYTPLNGFANSIDSDDFDDTAELENLAASFKLPLTPGPTYSLAETPASASPRPAFDIPPATAQQVQKNSAPVARAGGTMPRDSQYSTLSENNPFKANSDDFVRIDEPEPETARPAVVFPNDEDRAPKQEFQPPKDQERAPSGASPTSRDENEHALREALMNLQRMGK